VRGAAAAAVAHADASDDEAERLLEPVLRVPSSTVASCGLPYAASTRTTGTTRPAQPLRPTRAVACKVHKSDEDPPTEGCALLC